MSLLTVSLPPNAQAFLVRWMRRFPEISEEEALVDLWHQGIQCNETYAAFMRWTKHCLDIEYNVIEHPDRFKGWHLVSADLHKPGVYRVAFSRWVRTGAEFQNGFVDQDILRIAIEQKLCTKADGFTLPPRD